MEAIPIISQSLNTVMLLVLAYGLSQRRRARVHVPVMLTAFSGDVINVLMIEVYSRSRGEGAVAQGLEAMAGGGELIERVHIWVSAFCIIGYVVALITGLRLLKGRSGRKVHKVNACIFIATRLSSYVTSFWMGD